MPFEAVVCPQCGGSDDRDFIQVEPDTYYCPFHKGLFKYVDPRQVKVKVEGTYCPCGNLTEFQCQQCKELLCRQCDTFGMPGIILDSPEFGYEAALRAAFKPEYQQRWSLAEGRLVTKTPVSGLVGPFLFSGDVLPQIPLAVSGALHHLCLPCLNAKIPAAAKRIAAGHQCEEPGCGEPTQKQCRCCKQGFCKQHVTPPDGDAPTRPSAVSAAEIWAHAGYRMVQFASTVYYFPKLNGVCRLCSGERVTQARRKVTALCEAQPGLLRLTSDQLEIRLGYTKFNIASGGDRKLRAIEGRVRPLIMSMLNHLAGLPGPCHRDEGFPENAANLLEFPGSFAYRVIDRTPS